MKKKIIFIMPNAKLAFNIAQVLFVRTFTPLIENEPTEDEPLTIDPPRDQSVQSHRAAARSAYTAPIKAPTKRRSTKATKWELFLERWYVKSVATAQAQPRTETIKSTRM